MGVGNMRDKRKPAEYFSDYIDYEKSRIAKKEAKLKDCNEEDKITRISGNLFLSQMNLLVASFSVGATKAEMQEIHSALSATAKHIQTIPYRDALVMASFAVMLGNASAMEPVLNRFSSVFNGDKLLNGLATYLREGTAIWTGTYKYASYSDLDAVLSARSTDDAERELLAYLSVWYSKCSDCAWYDTLNSPNDVYNGYWCFEAAALSVILDLNECVLAGSEYYPAL